MQSVGPLKLGIVFIFPVSVTACRGLAISCVTQNLKTSIFRWVFSTSPGELYRISSLVAGLIPGQRTSATPRFVLQISDRFRRYPIRIAQNGLPTLHNRFLISKDTFSIQQQNDLKIKGPQCETIACINLYSPSCSIQHT